jgi:hypothetical protein
MSVWCVILLVICYVTWSVIASILFLSLDVALLSIISCVTNVNFLSMLVSRYHIWLRVKILYPFKLLLCRWVLMVSFNKWSFYFVALTNIFVFLKLILWHVFIVCSNTVHLLVNKGVCVHVLFALRLHGAPHLSHIHLIPHLHRMQYTPSTFHLRLSFTNLSMLFYSWLANAPS